MALESLSTQMTHITSYYFNPPLRTIRICVRATFRDWTKWQLSVQSDHPTSKRGPDFIQKHHPLVWLKGPRARHRTSPPPQRDENCVTTRESVFDRIQTLASWTPLCMLHSFPFLESPILISCACLGAHLYFSSLIHNSNRNLKDQLSCYFATIRWLPVVLFCVLAGDGGGKHRSRQLHLLSRAGEESEKWWCSKIIRHDMPWCCFVGDMVTVCGLVSRGESAEPQSVILSNTRTEGQRPLSGIQLEATAWIYCCKICVSAFLGECVIVWNCVKMCACVCVCGFWPCSTARRCCKCEFSFGVSPWGNVASTDSHSAEVFLNLFTPGFVLKCPQCFPG